MDEIIKLSEKINIESNTNTKVKMINTLNKMIETEKNELNNILQQYSNNTNELLKSYKIPIKYKKCSLDELEELFNKSNNINEKIILYRTINKAIENITDDLFETD